MEYWNTGKLVFKRILASFNFTVNTHFIINPMSHYLYEPEAHNSLFHYSNWGEEVRLSYYMFLHSNAIPVAGRIHEDLTWKVLRPY